MHLEFAQPLKHSLLSFRQSHQSIYLSFCHFFLSYCTIFRYSIPYSSKGHRLIAEKCRNMCLLSKNFLLVSSSLSRRNMKSSQRFSANSRRFPIILLKRIAVKAKEGQSLLLDWRKLCPKSIFNFNSLPAELLHLSRKKYATFTDCSLSILNWATLPSSSSSQLVRRARGESQK